MNFSAALLRPSARAHLGLIASVSSLAACMLVSDSHLHPLVRLETSAPADGTLLGHRVPSGGPLSGPSYLTVLDATPTLVPEPARAALFTGVCALGRRFFLRPRRTHA